MKTKRLYLLILLPFLGIILINESIKLVKKEKGHFRQGVAAINSSNRNVEQCSWACHDDTTFCKKNHVKWMGNHFDLIDPIYFGIIQQLKATGNYGLANIIFLVILIPLFIAFL